MATLAIKPVIRLRHDDRFFIGMAILILVTVFLGFAQTYYLAGLFHAPLPAPVIHVHGAVYSSWLFLFVTQLALIPAGRLDLHRRLGIVGAILAAAMVILGLFAATDSLARNFAPAGSPFTPQAFYAIPFFESLTFGVLITSALRARADGDAHKRLILIATIALLGPAVVRWPFTFLRQYAFLALPIIDCFVALLAAYDLWSRRRIHPATWKGGAFLFAAQCVMVTIGQAPPWQAFANEAAQLWRALP